VKLGIVCRPFSFHGGVETATAGLLAGLARHGHEVTLISTRRQPEVPGIRVRRLRMPPGPAALRLVAFALLARRAIRTGGYDLVQSHERTLLQDIYRAGEGTHAGYLAAMDGSRSRVGSYHRIVKALEHRVFSAACTRHVVAISEQGRQEIARLYGTADDRLSVVYNGVDLERFHPGVRERWRASQRERLGLPGDGWVVLFVGSGFARKGLDTLIAGLAGLAEPDAWLLVAGKGEAGPYRRLAEQAGVAERVRWLGPEPEVERLYAAADILALPARYEPFGNVHLEALACGLPVLTSRRAGGAELIRPGDNGVVVAPADPRSVTEGLARLRAADPQALAAAARRSAEPYSIDAWVEAFGVIYRRLTGGGPGRR
jgi:UDP-glucose:(heptosyl)LPS alpha-1,3-glucosyltransferase